MQSKLSFIPFFCEGFSTNPKVYKLIDDIYVKDKILFYETAKKNPWYTHPISKEGSLEQEEYFKKSLGLFSNLDKYGTDILEIIKRGWRYTYTYTQNHNSILLEDFLTSFSRKNKGLDNILEDEVNSNINMLIAIALNKIDKSSELYVDYVYSLVKRLDHYKNTNPNRISIDKATKDELKIIREIKCKISSKYGDLKKLANLEIEKTSLSDWSSAIDFLLDYENISLISISNDIKFSDKDIDEIIYIWTLCFKENLDITEIGKFILYMVSLKYFCKAYKKAKEYHFNNNKETMYIELEVLENELNSFKIKNKSLTDTNDDLQKKLTQIEKENLRLKSEIQKVTDNKNELIALRDFAFKQDQQLNDNSLDKNIDLTEINKVKGLILGGSNKWALKMKDLLYNYKFISIDALNFDKRLLDDVEIIFIYTDYLNHALYYKLMSFGKDKKIVYLKSNINQDIVLKQIYDELSLKDNKAVKKN